MEEMEKADSEPIPTNDEASNVQGKSCALCGCATPAVRCDRCNSQMFCLSCDDMYHRHPKRKLHLRKAVDSIWSSARSPRLRRRTDLPGDPCKIPIPPPRTKKRERHTIGGRMFLKSGLELGSFGHSKVFDPKNLPTSRDFFTGQKSPASMGESNCDDNSSLKNQSGQIYENDNIGNTDGNLDGNFPDRSPWNTRPNISSPIQVSIPSNSPDIVANGQSFGYPTKPHSQSAADLSGHAGHPAGPHPYHFHPPYPYMHPSMHPYSHSMAHLNCAQCISSSWSNLMSPHPSPYFHPMPWGSAQNTMSRGQPIPGHPGPMKHSHGDLVSYPDSNFHYPYPGGGYYHNGPPVVDPNFIKDLHEQAEMQKQMKETVGSKPSPMNEEEMDTTTMNPGSEETEPSSASNVVTSTVAYASAKRDVREVDEEPPVPEKPTEPWTCAHCTYINPPGNYICEVCCKTSYGNKPLKESEDQGEMRSMSRDSESPLINRDALLNSPEYSGFKEAQKADDVQLSETDMRDQSISRASNISEASAKLTTETQTLTTTKTTDAQTQNIQLKSIALSTDSIFLKQEISVQTEVEAAAPQNCSVATDPMISSQSLESLLSGVSAPPYHNRRAGWGRGATSFSTQSLYERGRSRSPMPRSLSFYNEPHTFGRSSNFASEEAMHSASQAWLYTDPMYYKPHNQELGHSLTKEDYFDGTWGSMDKLNQRVKQKKDKGKVDHTQPKFHRSLDDLKAEKRPEIIHAPELLMLQTVKEAERCGFSLEDLHVAYLNCGKQNPVYWLEDNWSSMIKNVVALAAKYGEDNEENDVGPLTTTEAKDALRIHRGDLWDAVTECIENRQRKILELTVRGNFTQKQIAEALRNNEGNVELAYADLVRASTRRHKFILSPGLSEDSEDLNIYNPTEDSTVDHHLSPLKAPKLDTSADSKTEKKRSDFFTKLTSIRQAQSERRKAREEKELIRETITQDFPTSVESEAALKDKAMTPLSMSREDSKEVDDIIPDGLPLSEAETEIKVEEVPTLENVVNIKEGTEDNVPVDFDTNWSESQGEWIEEYSDEQWEGDDEHWVGLGKKFQKMEKEFEEEARQMASLWEKEELEDDVFEDDAKIQPEVDVIADSDKKFDDWVKANLKVDSSEYEEEEMKGKSLGEDIPPVSPISLKERIELEVSGSSPLQHYPTEHDLSLKSQYESDWVNLPADEEIEKLAHDIVCEGSDIENKFDEADVLSYEDEKKPMKFSDQGSDEDWEKIEMEEQLQEVNELDRFAFPEKEGEIDTNFEELSEGATESQITIDRDSKVLYKNLEITTTADDARETITDSIEQTTDQISKSYTREKIPSDEGDLPMPPVRRKSKLNSAAIEQALKNQALTQISADIPPPLPEKAKHKDSQLQKMTDIYALPDKTSKLSQEETESRVEISPPVPQKPPRLNLSTLSPAESALQLSREEENEPEVPSKTMLSKEASPLSLSYESDSNCFADSESDIEIKLHRQKNKVHKLAKYENEFEDTELESVSWQKREKMALEEKEDVLESNFDIELDDDIDPALIEPLPRMKDFDFDPELPIMLAGRGSRISDVEDVDAPKAFREDTGRPLQLFKAVKRETPTNTLSRTPASSFELQEFETSILRTNEGKPLMVGPPAGSDLSANKNANIQIQPFETSPSPLQSTVYENQLVESYYYNEAMAPEQNLITNQILDNQTSVDQIEVVEELKNQLKQEIIPSEPEIQSVLPIQEQDEMTATEMGSSFAAADYFYGRYDEITVTHPKKKTSVRVKPTITDTLLTDTKAMSISETTSVPKPDTPSQMDQSATAVLQVTDTVSSTSNDQMLLPPVKVKEPVPSEPLPFAEDYLFGAYQVTIPRKTKSRPVVLATIPKLEDLRAQSSRKEQKPSASTTMPAPIATPEPPEEPTEEPTEEEPEEQVSEEEENAIIADTSSIYDEIFHDLPPEMLSNQSFDESSIYESFQDAVEDVQGSIITSSVVNVRPKSVHFEESGAPAVPPRRNKSQGGPKAKAAASTASNESYADEYLFRQYEQVTQATQAKKKLPVGSEDFRMQQGFEPTDFPCDSPLMSNEQDEDAMSSEISADIPSKLIESPKYSSEYDFGDSEQLFGSIMQEEAIKAAMGAVKSSIPCSEDSSVSIEKVSEIISPGTGPESLTGTDLLTCEKSESFEELSIPDQSDEVMESSYVSNDFSVLEECKIVSGDMSSTVTESQFNNMQSSQTSDIKSYEPSVSSEMEQFVFIERTQEIIDDSYDLYDIQESLDLNYIDIKGNIEDECTDDSEQEWKRNEDRKNYLNATFLKSGPSKKIIEEKETVQEEGIMSEFEKSSLEESGDHLPSTDKLKPEESPEIQDKNRDVTDKKYLENLNKENLKETSFTEEFATANIDDHTVEVLDIESMKSVSGAVKTSDYEQKDFVEIEYKSSESTEKILLEQNETYLQAVAESIKQEIPESFDQIVAESIDQEVSKSIEQDISESIDQEIPESLEQDIAESIDQEVPEFIEQDIAESVYQEVPKSIEQDIAESINEMPGESIDDLIEAINQEITYVDDEFTESAFEPLSEECLEISEDFNLISSISESSSLLSMQEDYIKAEIEEVGSTEEDLDASDDQQLDILEELASGELSDDNASSHSSVSTQIAVSMTQGLKEIEGDESSLIFEQSENLESDYEASTAASLSSEIISGKVQNEEEGFSNHIPKEESFEKLEEISETTVLKDIECEDSFKIDAFDSAEITPPSPSMDKHQIERYSPEIDINESATTTEDISKVFRESYLDEFILTSDKQMGIVKISEKTEIETEEISQTLFDENIDQSLSESLDVNRKFDIEQKIISDGYTGEILMQNVDVSTDQNIIVKVENIDSADGSVHVDNKEVKLQSAEIDSESMEEEDCALPIMSHFYDDLYQASSIQFSHLSIESIYAKYGTAESSESGNESDVDNALNNLSEDISQEILISQKEDIIDHFIPEDQFKEKDPEELDYSIEISLHEELLDGTELDDRTDICDTSKTDYTHPSENMPLVKSIDELPSENMQEILHKTLDREICFRTEIASFQKGAETLSVYKESDESVQDVKDLEGSDMKTTKNKFSTSKSCQTEDSFEEDIFFDSFDDTFTIPSYIHLPIEDNLAKPQTSEISIQCELISIEDILASKNILTAVTQTETIASENQAVRSLPDSIEEPKLSEKEFKQVTSPYEEKDESSCESFEDSDSDIFIESPSSHDEFEPSTKKGYLYAEVDSDTGFSSGSEYGWTRKKDFKQKDLKKTSEIKVVTEVQSQQISTTASKTIRETSADSIEVDSKTVDIRISEKSDIKSEKKYSDTSQSEGRAPALPIEIIERAITPVAIPQVPSLEEDLVFVEIEENIETEENDKNSDEKQKEVISAIPTVEYFYGSLPETVAVESLPDVNDKYFETASELSESISLTHDRTESFSDSASSIPLLDQMPRILGIPSKELVSSEVKILKEDETFAPSKSEINDSISEYYPLSESSISLAARASQTESDIFDLAQSEISDASWRESLADSSAYEDNLNGFTVAPIHLPTDEKKEDENNSAENLQLSASDIEKDIASDSKGNLTDSDLKALSSEIQHKIEASDEVFSIESYKTLPKDKVVESVERKQLADSEPYISEKDSKSDEESIPGIEYEPEISDITKPFSDVPPAPSDIVRYLYYDDSITFDDESYHSQSENLEIPSLPAEEMNIESSADKSFENLVKQDICQEKPVEEFESHVEKISTAIPEHVTLTETNMTFELDQKNREILDKRPLESQMVPELTSFPTDTSFIGIIENISADVSKVPTFEEVHESELPALDDVTVPETDLKLSALEELSTSKDVDITPETDVKFPTVEVIVSENVIDLPATAEQTQEPVVHIDEQLPESITATNIPPVHVSILKEDTDSQNIESINIKPISLDVPSDIVRYLYYGEDITFDDASQSSFLSQSDSHTSGMPSEDLQPQLDIDKLSDDSAPGIEQELSQDLIKDSFHLLGEEFLVAKPDSSSVTDDLGLSLDSSEYIDNWFDMEEGRSTPSINGKKDRDSEQQSSTKSSVLKDSEQPCIPEYILSPIESNLPVGKTDIDEVTDISTHFTMTDDSDRFSDIESDTSLNFEEECMLPLEITHQIEIMDLKDDQMFVSCIEDDEINLRTPEVKDIPGGFQFIPAEPVDEEFIKSPVSAESIGLKEKFDECVTSTEFSEQHSIEQFAECLTSSETPYQLAPKSNQEHTVDFSQKLDECSISAEFSKLSKGNFISSKILDEDSDEKNIHEYLEEELKENFGECATPAEFSELSKEQFSECLTASEIFDKQPKKETVLCETVLEHSVKEQSDGVSASGEQFSLEDENGNFSEFYSDPEVSVTSTNGEILVASTNVEVPVASTNVKIPVAFTDAEVPVTSVKIEAPVTDPEIPVASIDAEVAVVSTDAEVAVVSTDTEALVTSTRAEILVISEEAEPLGTSPDIEGPIIATNTKCPVAFDALGKLLQTEIVETAFDKHDEMDISHYSLPEEDSHSAECSFVIAESDKRVIFPKEHELTLDSKAVKTTIVDKKDDIDTFYRLPDDDSPSMSTDNWSDADAMNIEAEESIYEIPLEDLNNICSGININTVAEEPKELLVDASVTESFDIREKEVIEAKGSDIIISEDQKAKMDIEGGETAKIKATESKYTATAEDTRDKFATETEKSEISSTDDTLHTCQISQTKEISVYEEPNPVTRETAFDKQCEILTQIGASESDPKQSSPTSLSSDMKNLSNVKMETESEISTTLREEVNIEFMSAALDSEPTSSVSEAFYDTQEVKSEAISSEELCLEEKATADVSPQPDLDDNSKVKITTDAAMENFQLVDEADIFQSSPLNVIKIKDVEISKVEDEYESSDLKISGVIEDDKEKIKEILPVDEKKEQTTLSVSCHRTEVSELQQTKEEFEIQTVVLPEEESSVIKDSEILPLDVQKLSLIKEDIQKFSETEVVEIVDFKGGISVHSAEIIRASLDETEDTSLNKSLVHESKVGKSDVVDFSSLKVLVPKTEEVTETVDFKGDIGKIKDHAIIQMTESTADIKEKAESKETNQEKFICSSDSNISEKVDFKGEFMISDDIIDFKSIETKSSSIDSDSVTIINKKDSKIKTNKHSLEIVDFKGQPVSNSITPVHVIENEVVDLKATDSMIGTLDSADSTNLKIKNHFETVDFKGQLTVNDSVSEIKEDASMSVKGIKTEKFRTHMKKDDASRQSLEIVDFKGQLGSNTEPISETITTEISTDLMKEKLHADQDVNKKFEDELETVDFKGQLTASIFEDISKIKIDGVAVDSKEIKFDLSEKSVADTKESKFENKMAKVDIKSEVTVDTVYETVDFKGVLPLNNKELQQEKISSDQTDVNSEIIKTKVCEELIAEENLPDTTTYIESVSLSYSGIEEPEIRTSEGTSIEHDVFDEALHDLSNSNLYCYDSYEQALTYDSPEIYVYDIRDQAVIFESQEQTFHDQIMISDISSNGITEESSELLSLEENLSAAEDTSGQFYSLTEDLEGSSIISTSDEFTDVQSQITESSDKWSDAEGDFSFEDAEFDRDKTPIRTSDEGMSIYSEEKEEFKDVTFDVQETESKIKSAVEKDEILRVLDSDKDVARVKVFDSLHVKELIELTEKPSEVQAVCEQTSVEKPPETVSVENIVSPDKEIAILPQSEEEYELFTAEKLSDLSLVSTSEDFTDVSTYQITTEGSEKWSDVESDIEHLEKEARIVLSTKISDQVISSDALNLSLEYSRTDIQEEKCDTEEQLFEHFADIKSIKEQLTTADSFSSLDAETAVSKTHEDASTDISSQFEKTESEYWLEAETEQSTSEFDEDLFSSERDDERQLEMTDNKRVIEEIVTAIPLSQIHSSEAATTTSTSSSYTDLENSDLTSDTCADISLQGYATENSDRWSDIEAEAEALIDDVLYRNIDITENVEVPDFPQLIKTADDFKDIAETPIPGSQLQIIQPFPETVTEISALSDVETKSKTETDGTANSESKSKLFESSKSVSSFENADSTSVNLTGTDSGLTSIPTDIPSLLSTPSSMTTIGVSDDELTNVTPLDATADESDKWSEISGDTSIEEFEEESSASLKVDIKLQDKESDVVSGEVGINLNKKQESVVEDNQKFDLEIKISEADGSVKETVSATDRDEKYDITETKFSLKMKDNIEELSQSILQTESFESSVEQTIDDVCKASPESSVKLETQIEIGIEKSKETIQSCIEEKGEVEDCLSSKIRDDSETLDNFTDVPTHTLTSEISEAYCEFESDHSVEELENHHVEEDIDTQYIQSTADINSQYSPESYEDSLANEGLLENAEDFVLDSIPENELENYEEDEYSLSDHFEINEDELIYPLPYNDWIEQSFELKEYGVEAVFSESGSDIHGLGIACEEYDDEDIQRAIDYNLSTFEENEENIENVGTTDSFKTMSNDASPHLKLSEREFDTWSTADAPSIEEEFEEHDDVLSKIDELLAEDFGLDIYPDSPQSDLTVDIEGYLQSDVLLSDEIHEDFTQIDNNCSPEDTQLMIDEGPEIADSETTSCEVMKGSNVLSETVSSEVIVKDLSDSQTDKKIKISELETVPSEVTLETSFVKIDKKFKTTDSEIVSSKVSLQKDSKASDLSVSEESNLFSKSAKETAEENKVSEVLSSHPKTDEEFRSKSEIDSSEVVFKKDSTEVLKTESVSSLNKESTLQVKATKEIPVESTVSEITSSKSICDKDFERLDSETLSNEMILKEESTEVLLSEYGSIRPCLEKSTKNFLEEIEMSNITSTGSENKELRRSEFETVSSEMKLKENSTQMLKTKLSSVSKESILVQETTKIIPQETKVSEIYPDQSRSLTPDSGMKIKLPESTATITDESKILKQRAVTTTFDETTDTVLPSDQLKKETEADQIISDKSKKNSGVEAELFVKSKLVSGAEAEVSVEDKQISSAEADASVKNKEISGAETGISVKGKQVSGVEVESSLESKQTSSIKAEASVKTKQISGADAEVVVESKQISVVEVEAPVKSKQILDVEAEVSIKGKQVSGEKAESSLKIKQISSVEKEASVSCKQISGVEGEAALKSKQVSDTDTELSVKLKSSQDSLTTSEDTSASLKLSLIDSGKQIKDVSKDSSTFSTSESDSSFDIPSKKLAKSIETSEKVSIKAETFTDLSNVSESTHSSQQLSESSKHSAVTAAESVEIKSNIPDLPVSKDEKHDEPPVSVTRKRSLSKEQVAAESVVAEVKPDIPKKIRQRSLDSKEKTPVKDESDEKPSLPPKTSKRRSVSDFPSSSFGESLSSSSESLGSFESAPSERSRKSSLKSSEEASMHSMSPEVPVRRSRASRSSMSTSSRSSSKDSDNSSAPSRSSSLKIRRRSSNFRDSEPIDLSKKRASIDDRMQKLQNEGKCTTKEKAFIAAKLIEMQFEEEDALLASRQCNTVYNAVKFLTQLCEMCNCRFPINLMASMVQCAHRACKECLRAHFTSLIHDRSVFTLLCPMCQTSDITDQNIQEYFIHLEMTLKNILEERVYDLFQRKLRDEVLNKDPNFHWCSQCSSGFIASPRLKKLYCPDCSAITCALCHQTWELEHEGVHCERFQQWKDMHTPEPPPAGLVKYLTDRGVSCPSCGIVYAQACAGCLMYKCSHCSFEFCGFCTQPQKRGRDCSSKICELRGIHIHHVQNCLFFIRDKDITEIQILLEEESVSYLTIPPKDQIVKSRCQVREQKNAHGNLTEDRCGRDIEPYCAGLCRTHYYEYLAEILRKNNVSPLSIMTIQDLQFMLRKSRILVPEKVKGETSEEYYERLLNVVSSTLT